jgi:N-acylglucosamine-6-phosphate 2-epimerase
VTAEHARLLDALRGGLIVSVQAPAGSVLNEPETIALLARCAAANGAAGVRIEGLERIAAVRRAVSLPIVGIVKRSVPGFAPYITPGLADVEAIAAAGAAIVAFDATPRARPDGATVETLVAAIGRAGCVAMADCADEQDGRRATAAGAQICATTLCGYTEPTRGAVLPALDLVRALVPIAGFAVCEGGIGSPAAAGAAFAAGAAAIVVGTAITNVDALVRSFAAATPRGAPD